MKHLEQQTWDEFHLASDIHMFHHQTFHRAGKILGSRFSNYHFLPPQLFQFGEPKVESQTVEQSE